MITPARPHFVGIDVSKATLDVAILPGETTFQVPNDATGWAVLLTRLPAEGALTIVLEATGAYHRGVTLALAGAGHPPAVVNPERTHAFIRSEGVRAKTDRIDAGLLARFGQQKQPAPSPVRPANARQLAELVACREDLTKSLVMAKNRLHVASELVRDVHEATIAFVSEQIAQVDQRIAATIAADEALAERRQILQSVPGVGPVLSAVLLAGLPELGVLGAKPIASLAGVAPHPRDSGTRHGTRAIRGGRRAIRKALFQMARTAVRCDPVMGGHYRQLRERLSDKAAVIACARRMLGILNAMLRDGLSWPHTQVGQGRFLPHTA